MNTGILHRNMAAKRVGTYVRERRRSLGLSRAELARRLGFVLGSVVSHVERGDARIAPEAMAGWARALELDPEKFAEELKAMMESGNPGEDVDLPLARAVWA